MKIIKVIAFVAMTVVFSHIGWKLFQIWIFSLPLGHPYTMHSHVTESLLVIPSIAFGISLIVYYTLLKRLSKRSIVGKILKEYRNLNPRERVIVHGTIKTGIGVLGISLMIIFGLKVIPPPSTVMVLFYLYIFFSPLITAIGIFDLYYGLKGKEHSKENDCFLHLGQ